jgi:hypothetical protein
LQNISIFFLRIFRNLSSFGIGVEFKVSYILTKLNIKSLNQKKLEKKKYLNKWKIYNSWILQKKINVDKK